VMSVYNVKFQLEGISSRDIIQHSDIANILYSENTLKRLKINVN
jgi:hypothetical protein